MSFRHIIIFAIGALLANLPLFTGNQLYGSEDLLAYYQWTREFGEAIQQGFLRPRWDPSGMEGLGAPSLIYYPPAFFYATSLLEWAGIDTWTAMRIVVFLCWWALGVLGWRFLSRLVKPAWAIAGGLALQWNPFLFHAVSLQNLFPFAVTALPLLWLIFASTEQQSGRLSLSVACALALLIATHQLVAFMALITLPAIFLPGIVQKAHGAWSRAIGWGLSCCVGLLLSGWHIYTAMTTMNLIQTDDWFEPFHCDWRNSFITPVATVFIHGMRWTGIQWGIGGLALLLLGATIFFLRNRPPAASGRDLVVKTASLTSAGFAAYFFASEWSYPVWQYAPLIDMVQWPYRFLAVLMPLVIIAIVMAGNCQTTVRKKLVAMALLATLPAMNILLQIRNAPTLTSPDFSAMRTLKYYSRPADLGEGWQDYLARGGFAKECAQQNVTILEEQNRSQAFSWRFKAEHSTTLILPVMTYPGWTLRINEQLVELRHDEMTGLILATIPEGLSRATLTWRTLPQERVGQAMSIAGLAITGVMIIWSFVRKNDYDEKS